MDLVKMRSSWCRVGPWTIWLVSLEEGKNWTQSQTQGAHHAMRKTENRMKLLQAKDAAACQRTTRNWERGPGQLHRGLRRNKPHWHLDLGLPASETESIDPWSEVTQLAVRCSSSPSKLTQQQRALSQNSERDTAVVCHDFLFKLGTEEGAHAPQCLCSRVCNSHDMDAA